MIYFRKQNLLIVLISILSLCTITPAFTQNNQSIQVFDRLNIQFNPGSIPDGVNETDGIIRLGNGRIALKKVSIPVFRRNTTATAKITLTSNGDPWDKSGSCFIIPKTSAINMINIAAGKTKYPAVDTTKLEKLVGITADSNYQPTVEIMRFMTPFGVGHFSGTNDSVSKKKNAGLYRRMGKRSGLEAGCE